MTGLFFLVDVKHKSFLPDYQCRWTGQAPGVGPQDRCRRGSRQCSYSRGNTGAHRNTRLHLRAKRRNGKGGSCPCCSGEGQFVVCAGDRGQEKNMNDRTLFIHNSYSLLREERKSKEVLSEGNNQETFLPRQVRPSGARRRPRGHVQTKEPSVLRQPWEHPGSAEHSSVSATKRSFTALVKHSCQTHCDM